MAPEQQASEESAPRIIKRYSNRKLYDTTESRYVTLQQIGEMVRRGEHVQIIDNKTKEDKTEVTLALILSEALKNKPRSIPLGTLRTLIQERGEKVLSTLREGPLGRLIPGGEEGEDGEERAETAVAGDPTTEDEPLAPKDAEEVPKPPPSRSRLDEFVETSKSTIDHLQANLDERVRAVVPGLGLIRELSEEMQALKQRVEAIEQAWDEFTANAANKMQVGDIKQEKPSAPGSREQPITARDGEPPTSPGQDETG